METWCRGRAVVDEKSWMKEGRLLGDPENLYLCVVMRGGAFVGLCALLCLRLSRTLIGSSGSQFTTEDATSGITR